jgi:putative pyruvate formate lyase activating enzyme
MADCPRLPRIVWKTDLHGTLEGLALLAGVVDVYLADFKFGKHCARRLGGVDNYWEILTRNLRLVAAEGDLIVRHLLLPGHLDCCFRPIVAWLHENMPDIKLSVRDGYLPHWHAARHPELALPLANGHAERAHELAIQAGLNLID